MFFTSNHQWQWQNLTLLPSTTHWVMVWGPNVLMKGYVAYRLGLLTSSPQDHPIGLATQTLTPSADPLHTQNMRQKDPRWAAFPIVVEHARSVSPFPDENLTKTLNVISTAVEFEELQPLTTMVESSIIQCGAWVIQQRR
jgi:hypothetical protein